MVISDKGSVAVAGVTGLQYIEGGMVNYLVTYAPGSNFVVNLTTPANSNYLSEYNQILSTLKFADDNLKMVQPCPPGKLCE